jgi:ketosteroid isomerase-like protein
MVLMACAEAALVVGLFGPVVLRSYGKQTGNGDERRREIETFNAKFLAAHQSMNTPAILAMWAEDGVSLLPETPPMMGKPAIAKFLGGVTEQLKGWRMEKMELDFQGIEVSGDWASEWAFEHQMLKPPDAGKPAFDGRGKMLLVLHREADGNWRIKREMWNQGQKESTK